MKTKLTEQKSLQMSAQVIQQTQNFRKGADNIISFWGYWVVCTALLNFALAFACSGSSALVWFLMIPECLVRYLMQKKTNLSANIFFIGAIQCMSGKVSNFQLYVYEGFIFWAGAMICLFILPKVSIHLLILATCMIFGYFIPCWKLNKKAKENV